MKIRWKWGKTRHRNKKRKAVIVTAAVLVVLAVLLVSYEAVKAVGRSNLQKRAKTAPPQVFPVETQELTEEEEKIWQEGWIKRGDQIYAYNEDIMTFLFMGIDKDEDVEKVEEGTDGGQADALFLLVLNPHRKVIQVIGINRNTMADVDIYNEEGAYVTTTTAQIAVQHGFGNGVEESCGYQMKAVQRLLYNLPINGYAAVHMNAIISLTDMIGGIELVSLEDVGSAFEGKSKGRLVIKKDEYVVLDGEKAYSYVRYRDVKMEGSADRRLERQQQFLGEFIRKAKAQTAKDITLPVKMYQAVAEQMVTDVTADEVAYLASTALDYRFDKSQFYSLKGKTVKGEKYEEFYVDEDALYELILDIFYEPVEEITVRQKEKG